MDTQPATHCPSELTSAGTRSGASAALLLALAAALAWPAAAEAQGHRPAGGRLLPWCGGDEIDGMCHPSCSPDPFAPTFDADCFSCNVLPPPEPKAACSVAGEPCEIHAGITRLGAMVESGSYDGRIMLQVTMAYWDAAAWDLSVNWGASSLDGYVVYAVARAGLEFRDAVEASPATSMAIECLLRDHAGRSLPLAAPAADRWFHGRRESWNTWSEDYMGFALGYTAADAWLRTAAETTAPYFDEYYGRVRQAVELAFSITADGSPPALTLDLDPDPDNPETEPVLMLRNHGENSPVYAIVILKHTADVNSLYMAAGLPPYFTCETRPENYEPLYRWALSKIEPNPDGAGSVFRSAACERDDGVLSYCDDRPGDPAGSPGSRREPGHYPIARPLADLCLAGGLEHFSATCDWYGPAGIRQAPHNYYFNCVFPEPVGTWNGAAGSSAL